MHSLTKLLKFKEGNALLNREINKNPSVAATCLRSVTFAAWICKGTRNGLIHYKVSADLYGKASLSFLVKICLVKRRKCTQNIPLL